MFNWLKNRRRKRILSTPWPAAWNAIIANNVGHYHGLTETEQKKLRDCTQIMVSEKHWEAHDGLAMSEEIKVTIAGTAALMLLGVEGFYFDRVHTVIVFPQPIRRKSRESLIIGRVSHNSGEAWQGGQVVFSWQDVLHDSNNPTDGRNLVIHEFAHCLDGIDGEMSGSLHFHDRATTKKWRQVSTAEYKALQLARKRRQPTLLDYYGATSRAEFFAVASETFFESPSQLKLDHSELYDLLVKYYRLDPIEWI